MSRTSSLVLLVLGVAAFAGCSQEPAASTVGLVYCTSPSTDPGAVQQVEYRDGDEVVASTELEVGTSYRAEVPADALIEVYVDDRLVGSSGVEDAPEGTVAGGYTALLGEGCPEYVEP